MVEFTDLSEASAAARMQAMWKAQVVKKQLAEERQLAESADQDETAALMGSGSDSAKPPGFAEVFGMAFTPVVLVATLILVVCQILIIIGFMLSFSIFIDDLTTFSSDGKAATIRLSSMYALALLGALGALVAMLKMLLLELGGERMVVSVRTKMINSIGERRQAWFDDQRPAMLTSLLGPSVDVVRDQFFKVSILLFFDIGNIVCGIAALAILNVEAMGISLAIIPGLAILAAIFSMAMRKYTVAYEEATARGNVEAGEFIGSIGEIRAMGTQKKEIDDYLDSVRDTSAFYRKMSWSAAIYECVSIFLSVIGLVVLMYYEGILVEDNEMSVGTVITALAIAVFTLRSFQHLFVMVMKLQGGKVTAERMVTLLNNADADDQTFTNRLGAKHADFSASTSGTVVFRKVDFFYRQRPGYKVLANFNLEVPTGKTVALVGSSGGGKTTVANLLMRAYRAREGVISVDGTDIVDFEETSFSQEVGMVQQEPVMFAGSVSYNITYGFQGILSQEDVQTAAKFADCHRFISRLPEGYDSMIGEGFLKLSPGQKQRIAIARIFAKNPSICILDEPCNGLDEESTKTVRVAIRRMLRYPVRRTGLLIAHNPADLAAADIAAFLVGGAITEIGTPEELLADPASKYSRMMSGETVVREAKGVKTLGGSKSIVVHRPGSGGAARPGSSGGRRALPSNQVAPDRA